MSILVLSLNGSQNYKILNTPIYSLNPMNVEKIFINPCHGNEPYILAASIAQGIAEKIPGSANSRPIIVVPLLYGKKQARIMSEEGLMKENVLLDEELGNIYRTFTFKDGDFTQNIDDLLAKQQEAERGIRNHLRNKYGTVDLEINAGSQVSTGLRSFLAYPSIYTELYRRTQQEPDLMQHIPAGRLGVLIEMMQKVEEGIETFFIPSYNTFSYDSNRQQHSKEVSTPPLKHILQQNTEEIPPDSVYFMLSGTGSERENTLDLARQTRAQGKHVILSQSVESDEFERRSPDIISNDNIIEVVGRAGWGTIWLCQNLGKKFGALAYTPGDEPEIYFNIKTLQTNPIKQATRQQFERFGTLDGINYVVNEILSRLQ